MYFPYFTISNEILKNIGLIEAAREVIKNSPLLPLYEKKFQEEAIVRAVHHSTHLEGNPLNLAEVQKVVEGEKVIARERDVQEVINYRNVVNYIATRQQGNKATGQEEITEELVKKLHKIITKRVLSAEDCGAYRTKQVVIRNSRTGQVCFRPPPAVEVPFLMEEFLIWLNGMGAKQIHPILKAGVAQYEIVNIHPFLDGNGRVARALATLILYNEGYDIRRFFSLEEHYDKDPEGYYRALQSVHGEVGPRQARSNLLRKEDYDLTPWLEYFTQGLAIELTRVKEKVQALSQDIALKKSLGDKQIYLSERQIKIIEFIQRAGQFQNKDFSVVFPMVSEDTVLREIKSLMKKGIIIKKGRTKAARYVLKRT